MPNRLINETSPYLRQHTDNPVNWEPWDEAALQRARQENKPIFLSIGYAACHWCHVMAHESFEDEGIAALLNEHFICIKVDREERPDLDSIYMNAVVAMTGQGGWPMSVFLTPELEPFYGGTYFPPVRRYQMPAFGEVLTGIWQAWTEDRTNLLQSAKRLTRHLRERAEWGTQSGAFEPESLSAAAEALINSQDGRNGGWGRAPKFPQPMAIAFLLGQAARGNARALDAAVAALRAMQRGGLMDLIGGGFHRYSTDERWLVPHFEKMLYDNAQLAAVYLRGWQLTGEESFRQTCEATLDFMLREMQDPAGGFYSSLDADSEGGEGYFYTWSAEELRALLERHEWQVVEMLYGITERGNFEGRMILQAQMTQSAAAARLGMPPEPFYAALESAHARLRTARAKRSRPLTDDKVLVGWNALALRVFAEAAFPLKRADYLAAAQKNAAFLLSQMFINGRLRRAWRAGEARHAGTLEDYAGLILGLVALYQADFNLQWLRAARVLTEQMQIDFVDPNGGFYDTSAAAGELLLRPKDLPDNATPAGNALATQALIIMAALDERPDWFDQAAAMLTGLQGSAAAHPLSFGCWLQGLDAAVGPLRQVAIVWQADGEGPDALLAAILNDYTHNVIITASPYPPEKDAPALLQNRPPLNGQPTAYVCTGATCQLPVTEPDRLRMMISG